MLCKIEKPFGLSHDGHNSTDMEEGQQADIPDHLVPGLKREGYISILSENGNAPGLSSSR